MLGEATQLSAGNEARPSASDINGTLVMPTRGGSELDATVALPKGSAPSAPPGSQPMSHSISSIQPVTSDVADQVPASIDENMPTLARPGELSSLSAPRPVSARDLGLDSINDWADSSSANVLAGRE